MKKIPTWRRTLFWTTFILSILFAVISVLFTDNLPERPITDGFFILLMNGFMGFITVWVCYGMIHVFVFFAPFALFGIHFVLKRLINLRKKIINQLFGDSDSSNET